MDKPLFRRRDANRGRNRLAGVILAGMVNLGIVAAFLLGVQVAPIMIPATPLTISIEKHIQPPPPVLTLAPVLRAPQTISMPAPEFAIQPDAPSVVASATPAAAPAAGVPAAPASVMAGIVDPAYLKLIQRHLQKYLTDLKLGRDDASRGIVNLHFIIDRTGRVLSFDIQKSSGYASLDNDALILIQKASPLPPMPDSMIGDRLNAAIPISFTINTSAPPDSALSRSGFRR